MNQCVRVNWTNWDLNAETQKKIRWVRKMYNDWRNNHHQHRPDLSSISCDLENLSTVNKANLSYALCHFLGEVRKVDGTDFQGKTLYEILVTVQMYLESEGVNWKLLDGQEFVNMKFTLDNLMKPHTQSGLGCHVCKASVLTYEQEDFMWANGILGCSNPQQLVDTLIYLLGVHCALRAGKEHRALRAPGKNSQFSFFFENSIHCLKYVEDQGLKTNKGGIKERKLKAKSVTVYPQQNPNQ